MTKHASRADLELTPDRPMRPKSLVAEFSTIYGDIRCEVLRPNPGASLEVHVFGWNGMRTYFIPGMPFCDATLAIAARNYLFDETPKGPLTPAEAGAEAGARRSA